MEVKIEEHPKNINKSCHISAKACELSDKGLKDWMPCFSCV